MDNPKNESTQTENGKEIAIAKKPAVGNNKASVGRWIGCFFILFAAYVVIQAIALSIARTIKIEGDFEWLPDTLGTFIGFGLLFFVSVFVIRKFMKTSFRDFVFGTEGKIDFKQIRTIFICWLIGMVLSMIISFATGEITAINLNPMGIPAILLTLLMAIVFTWMQTSYEEIAFRGVFLRAACGDKIELTAKCVVFGIISSAIFMAMHLANPEMLSQQTALDVIAGASGYFLMGAIMYFVNVAFGNLMPGLFIHWINNFFAFAILTQEVSAVKTGAIFYQTGSSAGTGSFLSVVITYAPIIILIIVNLVRNHKKKADINEAGANE